MTRLIEFGRFAAERRQKRGLGKPETFTFLGFTYMCAMDRHGRFALRRVTEKKPMRAPTCTSSPGPTSSDTRS